MNEHLESWVKSAVEAGLRPVQANRIATLIEESLGAEKINNLDAYSIKMLASAILEGMVFSALNLFSKENVAKILRESPENVYYETAVALSRKISEEVSESLVFYKSTNSLIVKVLTHQASVVRKAESLVDLTEFYVSQQAVRMEGVIESIPIGEKEVSEGTLERATRNTIIGWKKLIRLLKDSGHWVENWNRYGSRSLGWAETEELLETINRYISILPADDLSLKDIRSTINVHWNKLEPIVKEEMKKNCHWVPPI